MKFGPKETKELNQYLLPGRNRKREFLGGDITFASDMARPEPKREVVEIDAFNQFNVRNPKADGGMLVQPSDDGSRPGYAARDSSTPPRKTFEKEYKKFKGSDREFAEFLNKKYKTSTNTTSSVESMRRRLGLKTVNPKATGDYKGLEKYINNLFYTIIKHEYKYDKGLFSWNEIEEWNVDLNHIQKTSTKYTLI